MKFRGESRRAAGERTLSRQDTERRASTPRPARRAAGSRDPVRDRRSPAMRARAADPPDSAARRRSERQRIKIAVAGRVELDGEIRVQDRERPLRVDLPAKPRAALDRARRAAAAAQRSIGDRRLPFMPAHRAAPPRPLSRTSTDPGRIEVLVSRRQLANKLRVAFGQRTPSRRSELRVPRRWRRVSEAFLDDEPGDRAVTQATAELA